MQTSDTAAPRDTSTRHALDAHLDDIATMTADARLALEHGADPADLVDVTRRLRSSAQQAATMAAYARALRPTVEARRG